MKIRWTIKTAPEGATVNLGRDGRLYVEVDAPNPAFAELVERAAASAGIELVRVQAAE